jgi:hypothetical protein
MLSVVLYGSLTLGEEHRLRVFENSVLRILGPKWEEDGSWRKMHNDELSGLYSSPNIVRVIKSRRMKWAGHVARMGEGRGSYRVLVGRPEGKRPLGSPRRRWKDNVSMGQTEFGWLRIGSSGFCEHGNEPSGSIRIFNDNLSDSFS